MDKGKTLKKNLLYLACSLLAVAVYYLVDGFQMFRNDYYASNNLIEALQTYEDGRAVSGGVSAIKYHIASLINLALVLIPVVFIGLRFHIPLRKNAPSDKTDTKWLISIARVLVGIMFFYYVITLGTIFSHEIFTEYYSFNLLYCAARITLAFVCLAAFVIDWPRFIKAIRNMPSDHPLFYKTIFVLAISVISCCMVEFQVGSKMQMASTMLLFNILYWILLQMFIDLLTPSVKFGAFFSLVLAFLIGLINDIVYQFRGNYVMFGDLTVVRTAMEVAGNYVYKPGKWLFISIALLVVSIVVTIIIRFPDEIAKKGKKITKKKLVIRGILEAVLVTGVFIMFATGTLYSNVFGVGWNYNDNVKFVGYIPYFLSNMNSIRSVDCEGYTSGNASLTIQDAIGNGSSEEKEYVTPNIILIQNEAFSDLGVVYDIETNQDPMPFIHSLTQNTHKGYLNMSVTGGPTANTEFEVLTQTSLQFFPYGSVPYTQYTNHDVPTVVAMLESQDVPYHTVAYHPYYSSGYKREGVYSYFGFDEVRFEDDFKNDFPETDIIRGYLSDEADYREVEQMYEEFRASSSAPWFCFNITIQGHGGYSGHFEFEDEVYVTNFEATESINTYLTLMKMSDTAFMHLLEYFSNVDEPTLIIMYGDHQPSFDDDAVQVLSEHPADHDGESSAVYQYYVPYVIWANYDIGEEDLMGINASQGTFNALSDNYLVSYALGIAGVELSDYDRYLLALHEDVPAITAIGVWDSEGDYSANAASSPYADELKGLEMVQYNRIFDKDNILYDHYLVNNG